MNVVLIGLLLVLSTAVGTYCWDDEPTANCTVHLYPVMHSAITYLTFGLVVVVVLAALAGGFLWIRHGSGTRLRPRRKDDTHRVPLQRNEVFR